MVSFIDISFPISFFCLQVSESHVFYLISNSEEVFLLQKRKEGGIQNKEFSEIAESEEEQEYDDVDGQRARVPTCSTSVFQEIPSKR